MMVNWLTVTNVDIVVGIDVAVVGNIEAIVMLMRYEMMMMVTNYRLMLMGIMVVGDNTVLCYNM